MLQAARARIRCRFKQPRIGAGVALLASCSAWTCDCAIRFPQRYTERSAKQIGRFPVLEMKITRGSKSKGKNQKFDAHFPDGTILKMLILASQSPRRKEILESAGIAFLVRVAPVDESVRSGEAPMSYVRRLAASKALAVPLESGEVILAADTTVVVDGQILGKPEDVDDARRMLQLLSGRTHEVLTGICLRKQGTLQIDGETTLVEFSELSASEIDDYVQSGEPMDKAGAYGAQGRAAKFIRRYEGCYFNVVGLPISLVYRHLKKIQKT